VLELRLAFRLGWSGLLVRLWGLFTKLSKGLGGFTLAPVRVVAGLWGLYRYNASPGRT